MKIPNFMRSLLGDGKVRPSGFGPIFHPWPLISVSPAYLRSLGYSLPLWDRTKPLCHLTFGFKSHSGMYAEALFEVPKNDLKKWVLEFVALLQPEREVVPAPLGQSVSHRILCECTSLDRGLTLSGSYLHSFLPCFLLRGIAPKCAAYQTCDSDTVSGRQTRISSGHNV